MSGDDRSSRGASSDARALSREVVDALQKELDELDDQITRSTQLSQTLLATLAAVVSSVLWLLTSSGQAMSAGLLATLFGGAVLAGTIGIAAVSRYSRLTVARKRTEVVIRQNRGIVAPHAASRTWTRFYAPLALSYAVLAPLMGWYLVHQQHQVVTAVATSTPGGAAISIFDPSTQHWMDAGTTPADPRASRSLLLPASLDEVGADVRIRFAIARCPRLDMARTVQQLGDPLHFDADLCAYDTVEVDPADAGLSTVIDAAATPPPLDAGPLDAGVATPAPDASDEGDGPIHCQARDVVAAPRGGSVRIGWCRVPAGHAVDFDIRLLVTTDVPACDRWYKEGWRVSGEANAAMQLLEDVDPHTGHPRDQSPGGTMRLAFTYHADARDTDRWAQFSFSSDNSTGDCGGQVNVDAPIHFTRANWSARASVH